MVTKRNVDDVLPIHWLVLSIDVSAYFADVWRNVNYHRYQWMNELISFLVLRLLQLNVVRACGCEKSENLPEFDHCWSTERSNDSELVQPNVVQSLGLDARPDRQVCLSKREYSSDHHWEDWCSKQDESINHERKRTVALFYFVMLLRRLRKKIVKSVWQRGGE